MLSPNGTIGAIHEDCSGFDFQPLTEAEQEKVRAQVLNEEKKTNNNSENK